MLNATNWFTLRDLDSESSSTVGLSYLSFNISLSVEFWRTWSFLMSALVMLIDFSSGLPGIPHTVMLLKSSSQNKAAFVNQFCGLLTG